MVNSKSDEQVGRIAPFPLPQGRHRTPVSAPESGSLAAVGPCDNCQRYQLSVIYEVVWCEHWFPLSSLLWVSLDKPFLSDPWEMGHWEMV